MEFGSIRAMLLWDVFPKLTRLSSFLAHFPLWQLLNCPASVRVDMLLNSSGCPQTTMISDNFRLFHCFSCSVSHWWSEHHDFSLNINGGRLSLHSVKRESCKCSPDTSMSMTRRIFACYHWLLMGSPVGFKHNISNHLSLVILRFPPLIAFADASCFGRCKLLTIIRFCLTWPALIYKTCMAPVVFERLPSCFPVLIRNCSLLVTFPLVVAARVSVRVIEDRSSTKHGQCLK